MKKRILVADDDPAILDVLKIMLESEDYEVEAISDSRLLLEKIYKPDLFLLDKWMVGADGLDICRYLKAHDATKNIPVIIISATPDVRQPAKEAGADDFVEKPFNMFYLLNKIARTISGDN